MAMDNRSITITLKVDNKNADEANVENQVNTDVMEDDKDAASKSIARYAVIQSLQLASNEIVAWAEYNWNRSLMLNDDYISQRNKNIALTQINRGISTISTIGSSIAVGNAILPGAGAAIGAVLGITTSAMSILRSNIQGMQQQEISMKQLDMSLDFTRSRSGYSLTAASIGEDL